MVKGCLALLLKFKRLLAYFYLACLLLMGVCVNAFPLTSSDDDTDSGHDCGKCNADYEQQTRNVPLEDRRHWCAIMSQFQHCIRQLEDVCKTDLHFQAGKIHVNAHESGFRCDHVRLTRNETLTIISGPHHQPSKCNRPKSNKYTTYKLCGLFGDPHLQTFDNRRHTCSVRGAWPLIDNRYLTVQVTNIPLGEDLRATATSKVTVEVKPSKRKCVKAKTYQASNTSLPAEFSDGTTTSGDGACSTTIEKLEEGRVKLKICQLKTELFIRKVGNYLTVVIKVPEDVMRRKTRGLCMRGCPRIEQMNMDSKMQRVNPFIYYNTKNSGLSKKVKKQRRKRAKRLCRGAKIAGFYYKSCLFDVMTSNDASFVSAAATAMKDFREINVDDLGKPIVNESLTRPTKRPRKLNPVRTSFPVRPTSAASAPHRTSIISTALTLLSATLLLLHTT